MAECAGDAGLWLGHRLSMLDGSNFSMLDPERIRFVDALRWLATSQPGDELPALVVNPLRPGRLEPRVRKRRPQKYPLLTRPRALLRQELTAQALKA